MKNQQEAYSLAVWSSYVEILGPVCSLMVSLDTMRQDLYCSGNFLHKLRQPVCLPCVLELNGQFIYNIL